VRPLATSRVSSSHPLVRLMLLSLFSSVALAGLVAAESAPHVARQAANISCTSVVNGSLAMQSPSTSQQWSLGVLAGSPLEVLTVGPTQIFSFESCTSAFMGYTSNSDQGLYYG
jgi:hypothetical protein